MSFSKTILLAAITAVTVGHSQAQIVLGSDQWVAGGSGCPKGWLYQGHCCDGSVIGAGTANPICCLNDQPVGTLYLVNAASSVGTSIEGNNLSINNVQGPSTCTAGTSTAFNSLPKTPVGNSGAGGPSTVTSTNSAGQTCVSVVDGGSISESCAGSGNSSGAQSGGGSAGITTSVSSSTGPAATGQTASTSTHGNAGFQVMATAAPMLAGAVMGFAAWM